MITHAPETLTLRAARTGSGVALAVGLSLGALLPGATATAQTLASPRGANGEGVGLEGTWDGALTLDLAYTRRLRTPILDRPAGMRFAVATSLPSLVVRTTAGVMLVAARQGDVALAVGLAAAASVSDVVGRAGGAFGLALGLQGGWMAERGYVTGFASVRPTLLSIAPTADGHDVRGLPGGRVVVGLQAGAALIPELIVFAAVGVAHPLGQGSSEPVITAGLRVHP